jgi:aconitate hydratase
VLSGNRNFEGRISPDVKMNYLASPPLVVAYALAGSMHFDFETDPLGKDAEGNDVFLKDIWPSPDEVQEVIDSSISRDQFIKQYATVFDGDERWTSLPTPEGPSSSGMPTRPTSARRRTSRACRWTSPR